MKRIIQTQWRLERLPKVEAALFVEPNIFVRYESNGEITRIPLESEPLASEQELDALNPDASVLGSGFSRAVNRFTALKRYEAHLLRSLERALHEFGRLQYARATNSLPHAVNRMKPIPIEHSPQAPQRLTMMSPAFSAEAQRIECEPRRWAETEDPAPPKAPTTTSSPELFIQPEAAAQSERGLPLNRSEVSAASHDNQISVRDRSSKSGIRHPRQNRTRARTRSLHGTGNHAS